VSGIMAAATSLGAVLSNGGTLDQTALITTAIAFILHAGKDLKAALHGNNYPPDHREGRHIEPADESSKQSELKLRVGRQDAAQV